MCESQWLPDSRIGRGEERGVVGVVFPKLSTRSNMPAGGVVAARAHPDGFRTVASLWIPFQTFRQTQALDE